MDRAAYMKDYRADYKTRVKIVKVTMPLSRFATLEARAKAEGSKPSTLAREFIEAGLKREARVPTEIRTELSSLSRLIRSVANNLNQIAHHSNTVRHVADERGVFQWLKALERHVADYTRGRLN